MTDNSMWSVKNIQTSRHSDNKTTCLSAKQSALQGVHETGLKPRCYSTSQFNTQQHTQPDTPPCLQTHRPTIISHNSTYPQNSPSTNIPLTTPSKRRNHEYQVVIYSPPPLTRANAPTHSHLSTNILTTAQPRVRTLTGKEIELDIEPEYKVNIHTYIHSPPAWPPFVPTSPPPTPPAPGCLGSAQLSPAHTSNPPHLYTITTLYDYRP